jgi:hypothetical protein
MAPTRQAEHITNPDPDTSTSQMSTMNDNAQHTNDGQAAKMTIRVLRIEDVDAVTRLAQLDSSREPAGVLLGAELDGRLVAAISTSTGEVIADPFRRTAEIVGALRLRAAASVDGRPRGRMRRVVARLRGASKSRAALPASPSG